MTRVIDFGREEDIQWLRMEILHIESSEPLSLKVETGTQTMHIFLRRDTLYSSINTSNSLESSKIQ